MWSSGRISLSVEETEETCVILAIGTPAGDLQIVGEVRRWDSVLHVAGVHIQGLHPGACGIEGLNDIARKVAGYFDVDEIVVEEAARTTGARKGRVPRPFRFSRQPKP